MSRLPLLGVSTCFRQVLSSVDPSRVNTRDPANILDGSYDLFFTPSLASYLPLDSSSPRCRS